MPTERKNMSVEFGRTAITKIIKGPVSMGPAIRMGTLATPSAPTGGIGSFAESVPRMSVPRVTRFNYPRSILEQANSVASAAWEATSSGLNAQDALLEAESILAQARVRLDVIKQAETVAAAAWNGPKVPDVFQSALADVNLDPSVKPAVFKFDILREVSQVAEAAWSKPLQAAKVLETATQAGIEPEVAQKWVAISVAPQIQTESKISSQTAQAASAPARQEQQVEEEVDKLTVRTVEAEEVTKLRAYKLGKAIDKVGVINEAKAGPDNEDSQEIDGAAVVRLLDPVKPEDESPVVRGKAPDGSRVETLEEFATKKFASRHQAKEAAQLLVSQKVPIKLAKEGKQVSEADVARVFKFFKRVKPKITYEMVVARVTKKRIYSGQSNIPVKEEVEIKSETSLEDYPDLAEVF